MKNTEVIMTAKTVEEAMAAARAQYGSPDNELSFEILEMPKKGFLGIGAAPAKVKVTISKALEEVDLSGLVSELKSMKIATDRGGDDEKPARPREEQKKQKPQQKQQPKQNQPKQAQNQNQPKAKPQQEQKKPAPAEVKEIKAETAAAKAEVKEIKAEAAAAKAEVKAIKAEAAAAKAEVDESNLPAALRRPVQKNQPQKNQKNQKKKPQPKPRDDRDGETKKKDLLSAVMGISDTKPATPSPAVTVTPTVMKPAPAKEEPAPETVPAEEKSTSLSAAVDAALAAIEAETPAPLPEEEAAAPDPREETRVEFITPAEMELALSFVNTLLADMKLEARAVAGEAREGEEGPEGTVVARVEIVGDDTGILIGHHGETLDAIQYLMNLSTSRRSGSGKREFVKILLDVGNYREKREETLRALARRTAARVVKYKRNIVLEPMNPYERRIIHSEIHNIPDVSTHSVGSDENRKIVITYEGADKPKDGGRRRGGEKNRRRGDRAERGEKPEKSEKSERSEKPRRERGERPAKPVRAKSIDEVQIDLSGDSDKTFGSILLDEGVETEKDPIEDIAREDEAKEENLREY